MVSLETPIGYNTGEAESDLAVRGNRRRLRVFLLVFVSVLAAGLTFTFSRPAEYRAQARISVRTATGVTALPVVAPGMATVTTSANTVGTSILQVEAGRLSSRPMIEAALAALQARGEAVPASGPDAVQGIQDKLTAETIPDTSFINVTLVGRHPAHLATILNALVDVYSREIIDQYTRSASSETGNLREELDSLERRVAEKRKALESFRQTADIVSGERDENRILARVKGLSASLNVATEKVALAEGRVRSLRESLAAGKAVVRARDNPGLAALEARASELRASLREQERSFTPQFMAMDQNTRAMRTRLADIEAQIAEERARSGQLSLTEAEDELASARQAQQKLQAQITEDRNAVHAFSRNFNTFEAMQAELAQVEASRRGLAERLLRTETSERSRMPSVQVIEAATTPHDVWRPDYGRDAWISVAVAFALGLLAMGVVELFNRPPRTSTAPVIVPQPWIALGQNLQPSLSAGPAFTPLAGAVASAARLPQAMALPRELSQDEVAALLQALRADDAVWAAMLLCGATPAEIRTLGEADLDAACGGVRLPEPDARTLRLPAMLFGRLAAASQRADRQGGAVINMPGSDDELKRRLLCAAHDAGLDDAAGVTPQTLRHTCIAFLVRQGLRFGELGQVVGPLSADALAGYAALSPAGVRRAPGEVELLMPALEALENPGSGAVG